MNISIGIVALNEEKQLPGLFEDILGQSYPHEKIELVLVDSMSEDQTKELMKQFADEHEKEFYNIQVIENPGRIQSCGWNEAIRAFTTDVLVRIDAHSSIPADFIEKNIEAQKAGEYVTGGIRRNIAAEESPWQDVLLMADSSMFGGSVAAVRRKTKKEYVRSFFHGAYRREVFEKAGEFREDLGRTEDNEFHYRVRRHGFRLCMVPGLVSYQMIRPSLLKMCRQKFANGYWVGLTVGVCPACLSPYHFVPYAFVCGIVLTTALAICHYPALAIVMWLLYWLLAVIMTVDAVRRKTFHARCLVLPFLFFFLHISYGAGTVVGVFTMPFWRGKNWVKQRNTQKTS